MAATQQIAVTRAPFGPSWTAFANEFQQFKVHSMRLTACLPPRAGSGVPGFSAAVSAFPHVVIGGYTNITQSAPATLADALDFPATRVFEPAGLLSIEAAPLPPGYVIPAGLTTGVESEWNDCQAVARLMGCIWLVQSALVVTMGTFVVELLVEYDVEYRGRI